MANHKIKSVISVCDIKDIATWGKASLRIPEYIQAEQYILIIPDQYRDVFRRVTHSAYQIVGERSFASRFDIEHVRQKMPLANWQRAGWYYQQLLKIEALLVFSREADDVAVIWDADTLPLRNIEFVREEGRIAYYTGSEHHPPYFAALQALTGLSKQVDFSFIAQCFPARRAWVVEFVREIEKRHRKAWFDAILDVTDLSQMSGFSEYETMGNFFANHYRAQMLVNRAYWERYGKRIAPIDSVTTIAPHKLPDYVSYESWC